MADYNHGDAKAKKHSDKQKGMGQQTPRPGFVRIGSPPNQSEVVNQQNVDWMNPSNL